MALDTSYLYFRAFFGVPTSLRGADGRPNNAVRGLFDSISLLVEQYSPDQIACAWDEDWRPDWRVRLLPSYKSHRVVEHVEDGVDVEETPDELRPQIPVIRRVLEHLGVVVIGAPDHEADDVLATLAAGHSGNTLVVSGDRDLFQLVSEHVHVVNVASSVKKNVLVDQEWVRRKYGIDPDRYVDFAVLRGDPSDGLPGVKGVGDKTAAKLIGEFGSLGELVEAARSGSGSLTPSVRRNVTEAADYISAAIPVVTTVGDLSLDSPTPLPLKVDADVVAGLRDELGLGGSIDRLVRALGR